MDFLFRFLRATSTLLLPIIGVVLLYSFIEWRFGSWNAYLEFAWDAIKLLLYFISAIVSVCVSVILLMYLVSRKRKHKVFIAHHHADEKLAQEIHDHLVDLGIRAEILLVSPRDHDDVIQQVRDKIRKSDAIIAIPPRTQESFSNAEILAASLSNLPLIFIVDDVSRSLPNTGLKGYPVFIYSKLKEYDYRPLGFFLDFVFFHQKDVLKTFFRALSELTVGLSIVLVAYVAIGELLELLAYFSPETFINLMKWTYLITYIILVIMLFYGIMVRVVKKVKAARSVKQSSIMGLFAFQVLGEVLGKNHADKQILDCLMKKELSVSYDANAVIDKV